MKPSRPSTSRTSRHRLQLWPLSEVVGEAAVVADADPEEAAVKIEAAGKQTAVAREVVARTRLTGAQDIAPTPQISAVTAISVMVGTPGTVWRQPRAPGSPGSPQSEKLTSLERIKKYPTIMTCFRAYLL